MSSIKFSLPWHRHLSNLYLTLECGVHISVDCRWQCFDLGEEEERWGVGVRVRGVEELFSSAPQ